MTLSDVALKIYTIYDMPDLSQEHQRELVALKEQQQCACETTELRWRRIGANGKQFVYQCMRCGGITGWAEKKYVRNPEAVPAMDRFLPGDYRKACEDAQRRLYNEYRRMAKEKGITIEYELLTDYNEYINSPEWEVKRQLVLKRDNNLCQGCLVNKAVQVHHLTYIHLGNELLFELISLCGKCHEYIHAKRIYSDTQPEDANDYF